MFVPFTTLPAAARIWIFQSNRPFTAEELTLVETKLRRFSDEWAVHGSPMETSFTIKFDQFIVLAADESRQNASGCSIDSSVRVLKDIEQSLRVQLLDRNQVAFKAQNGILLVSVQELKQNFQAGILNGDTLTFNNLVGTKAEFEKNWLVPAGEIWLKRYIPNPLAKVK
jgi:hypothetical protein